jgi:hypothetical protein
MLVVGVPALIGDPSFSFKLQPQWSNSFSTARSNAIAIRTESWGFDSWKRSVCL